MSFSPFARFRNFTLENLKALLDVYPDMAKQFSWGEAGDIVESESKGYKKTAYQQACQFGIEDRSYGKHEGGYAYEPAWKQSGSRKRTRFHDA